MKALLVSGEIDTLGYILQGHIVMGHLLTANDLAVPRNLTSLSGEILTTGGSQVTPAQVLTTRSEITPDKVLTSSWSQV